MRRRPGLWPRSRGAVGGAAGRSWRRCAGGPRPGPHRPDDRARRAVGVGDVARRGEGGVVVRRRSGGFGISGPTRPVSPPVHWGARPEVSHRRSPTAMSDRGRKVLALSLTALSSSLVLVLGLWALGVLAPSGDSRGTPSSTPVAPPSDTRPKGPATSALPKPSPPSREVAAGPGPPMRRNEHPR